jgi:membrane protease YdiL (CAAX protease family)
METPESTKSRALMEAAAAAFAVTALATIAVHGLARTPAAEYAGVVIALLFLVPAVRLSERADPTLARFGLVLGGLFGAPPTEASAPAPTWQARAMDALREIAFALAVAAVIFPVFAVGFRIWFEWQGLPFHQFKLAPPKEPLTFVLNQFLVVALPEEAFFRGYLQTRLGDAWTSRQRILGAELCVPAWLTASAVFGLIHVCADLDPLRFSVFFPGLLFGWVRARRGGIGAAIVLHALSNLFSETLAASWFGSGL